MHICVCAKGTKLCCIREKIKATTGAYEDRRMAIKCISVYWQPLQPQADLSVKQEVELVTMAVSTMAFEIR